jgi:hypothetical protein
VLETVEIVVAVVFVAPVGELTIRVCVTVVVAVTVEEEITLCVWVVVVALTSRLVEIVVSC